MTDHYIQKTREVLTPQRILILFGLLSFMVFLLHLPEKATALLFMAFFLALTALDPINGIVFILLAIPFFLGATHKPYFSLFEGLVIGYLGVAFVHLWKRKEPVKIPFRGLVLLLALSFFCSLPLNTREYFELIRDTPLKEIGFQVLRGHEKFPFFPLRVLYNNLTGILLFIVTFNLFSGKVARLGEVWKASIGMGTVLCLIGLLMVFGFIPSRPTTYLSLSLTGNHEGALSAFAFNRQYFAQYLIILFPLIIYFLYLTRRKVLSFSLYLCISVVFLLALAASMQRSVFLILFLEIFLFILVYILFFAHSKKAALLLFAPFLLLALMFVLDLTLLDKRFLNRFMQWGISDPDNRRYHLWMTAWRMFTFSPLLGVGLGKYYEFFPEFFKDPLLNWKVFGFVRGEPHSFYFQTLAEQGAIGFLLTIGLLAAIIIQMLKKMRKTPSTETRWSLTALMIALSGWCALGLFHNVAYVRSLGVFYWILFGWSASLLDSSILFHKSKWSTKGLLAGLMILFMAFIYQLKLINEYPNFTSPQTSSIAGRILQDATDSKEVPQRR
jgi:O-antigen ligase